MDWGRREVLKTTAGGVALAVGGSGTVGAAQSDDVVVSGQVVNHEGDPVASRKVSIGRGYSATDSNGEFVAEVSSNSRVTIGLYKSNADQLQAPVRNQVPHLYDMGSFEVGSSDTDLGTLRVPRAYLVDLRALDADGNPATDASFEYRSGTFGPGSSFGITDDGYLRINGADFTGVELSGVVNLSIVLDREYAKSVVVDESLTATARAGEGITIESRDEETTTATQTATATQTTAPPDTTEATTTTEDRTTRAPTAAPTTTEDRTTRAPTAAPTTTRESTTSPPAGTTTGTRTASTTQPPTDSQPSRGFISNDSDADGLEFLSDPFHLTVGGFVLSVAGIVHNMVRGR